MIFIFNRSVRTMLVFCFLSFLSVPSSYGMTVDYATNLKVDEVDGCYLVTVDRPYYGATEPEVVLLVPEDMEPSVSMDGISRIDIPLNRIVVGTTPAVACLDALDSLDLLVGLAGGKYVYTDSVRKMGLPEVASDGGMSRSLDKERLLELAPDGFITYLYGDEERRDVDFLRNCGVPVLFMAEYLEDSPLARAEWIKFIGLLVGREEQATEIFDKVVRRYEELASMVDKSQVRPLVLSGAPFGGVWYVPRRGSWPSIMFRAAGAKSLWNDLEGTGTAPMDLEAVLVRAESSDIWLNCGSWRSLEDAERSGLPIEAFPPFEKGEIYNNDRRVTSEGGNDYYQSGIIRPDMILADLISIIHPEKMRDHELFYYRKLQ